MEILNLEDINMAYPNGTIAIKNVNFSVDEGDFLAIIGPSGSGKSTLLRCINRILEASSGKIFLKKEDISCLEKRELREYQAKIGMIFQQFNLIKNYSVLRNVLCGKLHTTNIFRSIFGIYLDTEKDKARECLKQVGLSDKENSKVNQLSGGQQQRVAIARSLMQDPVLFLADEPVASLDPYSSTTVMKNLKNLNTKKAITVISSLHSIPVVKEYATKVIALKNGELVFTGKTADLNSKIINDIYE